MPVTIERLTPAPGTEVEVILSLRLPSDLALVDDAVRELTRSCFAADDRPASDRTRFRLQVVVAEAITNAITCGNAGDQTRSVAVRAELYPDRILVTVSDEGSGFNPKAIPDPSRPEAVESPCGRGLFLIRHLSDQVEFNDKGNTIWMTMPRW